MLYPRTKYIKSCAKLTALTNLKIDRLSSEQHRLYSLDPDLSSGIWSLLARFTVQRPFTAYGKSLACPAYGGRGGGVSTVFPR